MELIFFQAFIIGYPYRSRDRLVDAATGYGFVRRGSIPGMDKVFPHLHSVQRGHGSQPTGALSPGIKRPGREADHSPPSSGYRLLLYRLRTDPTENTALLLEKLVYRAASYK
jgi:hypothetical protein